MPKRGRKRRVLALVHQGLTPPANFLELEPAEQAEFRTEFNVLGALKSLGHEVEIVELEDELAPLRKAIKSFKPHVAFNLIEEFHGTPIYDHNVVSYLELMRVPYTGCNPRGLVIARDKALSKKILTYHRIPTPRFFVCRRGRKVRLPAKVRFPLIVKSLTEDASAGISERSVVRNEDALQERVEYIHRALDTHALAEEFIEGRELYVGIMGHKRLQTFPTWEVFLGDLRPDAPRVLTLRAKWDLDFQTDHKIMINRAEPIDDALEERMAKLARRIFRALNLSGYARIDFRLSEDGKPFFLEANPNPDVGLDAEFAHSAEYAGVSYEELIHKIVSLSARSLEV